MGPYDYVLELIKGDYAYLKRTDSPVLEPLMIALALLPDGADLGSKIHFENLEYTVV